MSRLVFRGLKSLCIVLALLAFVPVVRAQHSVNLTWANPDPTCSAMGGGSCTITYQVWRGWCRGCEEGVSTGVPFASTTATSWTDTNVNEPAATTFFYIVTVTETGNGRTVYWRSFRRGDRRCETARVYE